MQDNTSFEHFSLYSTACSTAPGSKSSQITLSDSLRPHLKQSIACVFSAKKKGWKVNLCQWFYSAKTLRHRIPSLKTLQTIQKLSEEC